MTTAWTRAAVIVLQQTPPVGRRSRSLPDGEQVVLQWRPHGRALVLPAVVLVLAMGLGGFAAARVPAGEQQALLRALVAALLLLVVVRASVVPFLRWRASTVTLTDRRVRLRSGVLRSRSRDVDLRRVANVVVERSLRQRLGSSGTLLLEAADERGGVVLREVPGVRDVAERIGRLLDGVPLEVEDDEAPLRRG